MRSPHDPGGLSAQERGSQLEQNVAEFYRHSGYEAHTNLRITGRSGVTHEVDVLAEKSDGVSTFRVGIECKSWARPIDKEVVAKTAYVFEDLGIGNRVIIASGGATESARIAAEVHSVDIWTLDALDARLRDAGLTLGDHRPDRYVIPASAVAHTGAEWHRTRNEAIESLIGRGEELIVTSRLWVPRVVMEWQLGIETGIFRKRRSSMRAVNYIEAILGGSGGQILDATAPDWTYGAREVELRDAVLPPSQFPEDTARGLSELYAGLHGNVSRELRKAADWYLGIDTNLVSVIGWELVWSNVVFSDVYVGIVKRRSEYVRAIDATTFQTLPQLEATLSERTWRLKELPGFGVPAIFTPPPPPPHRAVAPPGSGKGNASPY